MKNKLIRAQQMVFDELERLSDDELMKSGMGKREIERSSVISNNAQSLIKIITLQLKIKDVAKQNKISEKKLLKDLEIIKDE